MFMQSKGDVLQTLEINKLMFNNSTTRWLASLTQSQITFNTIERHHSDKNLVIIFNLCFLQTINNEGKGVILLSIFVTELNNTLFSSRNYPCLALPRKVTTYKIFTYKIQPGVAR